MQTTCYTCIVMTVIEFYLADHEVSTNGEASVMTTD